MSSTPTIVVAGTNSGVGKTTVAVALMHALHKAGVKVQPFKVGPDFLDGMQHEAACGVPSINLDGWLLERDGCLQCFHEAVAASAAEIAIVEGCMGLHDGRDGCSDEGSTAQVAKWLGAPVLLVVDAWSLSRSAAAMVHGYKTFDPEVLLAGVLFNRVAGTAHAEWLRQAMASAPSTATVAVLGCLPKEQRVAIEDRLLGLLPPPRPPSTTAASKGAADGAEGHAAEGAGRGGRQAARLEALRQLIGEHLDLRELRTVAARAAVPPPAPPPAPPLLSLCAPHGAEAAAALPRLPPVRVAVARDEAFCFCYHENLRRLSEARGRNPPAPTANTRLFRGSQPVTTI